MKGGRLTACALAAILPLLLSGCMQSVRLNQRAMVQGIGVDYEDGRYKLTLQLFDSKGAGGQNAIDPSKVNSMLVECTGLTLGEALEQAALKQGRQVFYGQNKLIVIGEEAARNGLEPILGFFNANQQSRPNVDVVTSVGPAAEVLSAQVSQSILPALSVKTMLENSKSHAKILRGQVFHLVDAMENGNLGSYTPLVVKSSQPDGSDQVEVEGTALYRHQKLAGALGPDETRGVLWLRNEVQSTRIAVETDQLGPATLEVVSAKTHIRPSIRDGVPHFSVTCALESHIKEAMEPSDGKGLAAHTQDLQTHASDVVQKEMEAALQHALRGSKSDVFNLANLLAFYEPAWYQANLNRYEELLPSFTFSLNVQTHISRYGLQN